MSTASGITLIFCVLSSAVKAEAVLENSMPAGRLPLYTSTILRIPFPALKELSAILPAVGVSLNTCSAMRLKLYSALSVLLARAELTALLPPTNAEVATMPVTTRAMTVSIRPKALRLFCI